MNKEIVLKAIDCLEKAARKYSIYSGVGAKTLLLSELASAGAFIGRGSDFMDLALAAYDSAAKGFIEKEALIKAAQDLRETLKDF